MWVGRGLAVVQSVSPFLWSVEEEAVSAAGSSSGLREMCNS